MTELNAIDTISADTIEAGDVFVAYGETYEAIKVSDDGDSIIVTVNSLDETDETDEIILDPFDRVEVVSYDYSDVEI